MATYAVTLAAASAAANAQDRPTDDDSDPSEVPSHHGADQSAGKKKGHKPNVWLADRRALRPKLGRQGMQRGGGRRAWQGRRGKKAK